MLAVSCTYSRQLLMFSFGNFKCLKSLLCARYMYIFFYWFSHSVFDLNTRPENWIALLIQNFAGSATLSIWLHACLLNVIPCVLSYTHTHILPAPAHHCHCNWLHFYALHASSTHGRHNNFMPDLKDSKEHFIIIIKLSIFNGIAAATCATAIAIWLHLPMRWWHQVIFAASHTHTRTQKMVGICFFPFPFSCNAFLQKIFNSFCVWQPTDYWE